METPAYRTQLIVAESERLGQYLQTLPRDAWSQRSACQGWTVRDVVGYLVWAAELYAKTVTHAGCAARPPPETDSLPRVRSRAIPPHPSLTA
jgi:hypothetical protein